MSQQSLDAVYPPYFDRYISLVSSVNFISTLQHQSDEAVELFSKIPIEKWPYRYEENKWTTKEVLQHITDTERVFSFRALVFARKDPNTFPSFNENDYAENSRANEQDPKDLIEEFLAVRKSTWLLFKSFSEEQLNSIGKASNYEMSVKAIGYMIPGHFQHHFNILKERYL